MTTLYVKLTVTIEYSLDYIIQGYWHTDNVFCDYTGETITGEEECLAWSYPPEKPEFI